MSKSDGARMVISVRALPTAIARIVLVIWVGTVAYADDQMVRLSDATEMTGKVVIDREGKFLGRIQDMVFLWHSDGYTEYAVLSLGGVFVKGEEHVAVPWEALTLNARKDHFVLDVNKVQLNDYHKLVAYRFYDRSFAAVLEVGRSAGDSSAHATRDNIKSSANASGQGRHSKPVNGHATEHITAAITNVSQFAGLQSPEDVASGRSATN